MHSILHYIHLEDCPKNLKLYWFNLEYKSKKEIKHNVYNVVDQIPLKYPVSIHVQKYIGIWA